jgi:NAD(P)H-flavin reductase
MASSPELGLGVGVDTEVMRPRPFLVRSNTRETGDTFTLALEAPEGGALPFSPGQFNMVCVFGMGEAPISISGDPARPETVVHTIRAVGTVTRALQRLDRGSLVGLRGPFGTAWPMAEAQGRDVVIVAGGIGLAPLRPALYHLLLHRSLYGRVVLLYGARTPRDILYARELRAWRSRFDFHVDVTVDRATADWQGSVGVVTKLIERSPFDAGSAIGLVCGPEVMIRFAAMALAHRGIPPGHLFISVERNMKCGVGFCGHCQLGPHFVCKDGPVFPWERALPFFGMREV